MAKDYEYDVFFSYKRHALTLEWTRQVVQRLKLWLSEELGGTQAKIFFDDASIEVGRDWPETLKEALRHSRCMVCVWSPSYFQSRWCISEWKSFLEREKLPQVKPRRLIVPLRFHDGEHFPPEAKTVQWEDVAPYASSIRAFWNSTKAIALEEKLKLFAHSLANTVRQAPPFDSDWPIVETEGLPAPKIGLAKL